MSATLTEEFEDIMLHKALELEEELRREERASDALLSAMLRKKNAATWSPPQVVRSQLGWS